jgi:hypothetical protein
MEMKRSILILMSLFFVIHAGQKQDVIDILTGYVVKSDDNPHAMIEFDGKSFECVGYRPSEDLYWYCTDHEKVKILHDESDRILVDVFDPSHQHEEDPLIFEMDDI